MANVLLMTLGLGFGSAVLVFGIGFLYLRAARSFGWQDVPGSRSLHDQPVVTSGGTVLAVTWLLVGGLCLWLGILPGILFLWGAMTVICAVIGFWDDRRFLPIPYRLTAFFVVVSATLACVWLLFGTLSLSAVGLLSMAFMILAGVWWLNAFNFMDGADGFATIQALFMIVVFLMVSALNVIADHAPLDSLMPLVIVLVISGCSVAAFLIFVAPTARCFLGNTGSLVLGQSLLLCGAGIVAVGNNPVLLSLAGGVFIWDATITLMFRWLEGKPVGQGHTEHAYQRIIQRTQIRLEQAGKAARQARAIAHRRAIYLLMTVNVLFVLPVLMMGYFTHPTLVGVIGHSAIALALLYFRLRQPVEN